MRVARFPVFAAATLVGLTVNGCTEPAPKPAVIAASSSVNVTGVVDQQIANPVAVLVTDAKGGTVSGVVVNFSVASGGGTLGSAMATSGADGKASTTWRLGTTSGAQTVTASVEGLTGSPVTFTATATAGAAAKLVANSGDGQTATTGTQVTTRPTVRVSDAFDNAVPNFPVQFAVTGGGGSLAAGTVFTTSTGLAVSPAWTLGPNPGTNSLSVSATGITQTVTFTATATLPVVPLQGAIFGGDKQAAMINAGLTNRPAVRVTSDGVPQQGVTVNFSIVLGGGTLSGGNTPTTSFAVTDANGVATLSGWTMGPEASVNTLIAAVAGSNVTTSPITFTASGCENFGAGYAITLCLTSDMNAGQKTAFRAAATKWSSVITGDLADVTLSAALPASLCGGFVFGLPAGTVIDDVVIFASVIPIDGANGILAGANNCGVRETNTLPWVGAMIFDQADFDQSPPAKLISTMTHEMGHVIGIGTIWSLLPNTTTPYLQNPATPGGQNVDTHFTGSSAVAAFNNAGAGAYSGLKVPVENGLASGSINSHWRESVLKAELMTPHLDENVATPLSAITVGSLQDLGYTVSFGAAEPYLFVAAQVAPGGQSSARPREIHGAPMVWPVFAMNGNGRILRRIR